MTNCAEKHRIAPLDSLADILPVLRNMEKCWHHDSMQITPFALFRFVQLMIRPLEDDLQCESEIGHVGATTCFW